MIKKLFALMLICIVPFALLSCSNDETGETVSTDAWQGIYMWADEETEEFKVIEAVQVDDTTVGFVMESSRITAEFEAQTKSSSGRYLVTNLGQKTVKITLSSDKETITVDDMWTDDIELRDENWTGKYRRVLEGEVIPSFGDKNWNGKYKNEETNLEVSVYGIKDGIALFSYEAVEADMEEDMEEDEDEALEVKHNFKCLEPEAGKAVYTEGERLIILERTSHGDIKVTDLYMNDSENKGISGIYKKGE